MGYWNIVLLNSHPVVVAELFGTFSDKTFASQQKLVNILVGQEVFADGQ